MLWNTNPASSLHQLIHAQYPFSDEKLSPGSLHSVKRFILIDLKGTGSQDGLMFWKPEDQLFSIPIISLPNRRLQFYYFLKNFYMSQMENARYWHKLSFSIWKVLKIFGFLHIHIQSLQKVLIWPKLIFCNKRKNAKFFAKFTLSDRGLKMLWQILQAKNLELTCKNKKNWQFA